MKPYSFFLCIVIIFTSSFSLLKSEYPWSPNLIQISKITDSGDKITFVKISGNGKFVSYVIKTQKIEKLFLADIDGIKKGTSEPVLIKEITGSDIDLPKLIIRGLSYDANKLLVQVVQADNSEIGLFIYNRQNQTTTRIEPYYKSPKSDVSDLYLLSNILNSGPVLSGDGKWILVRSSASWHCVFDNDKGWVCSTVPTGVGIYKIPTDGSEEEIRNGVELLSDGGFGNGHLPGYSANYDGNAYTNYITDLQNNSWTVDYSKSAGKNQILAKGVNGYKSINNLTNLYMSPDANFLLFLTNTDKGATTEALVYYDILKKQEKAILLPDSLKVETYNDAYGISEDGSRILFRARTNYPKFVASCWIYDVKDSSFIQISNEVVTDKTIVKNQLLASFNYKGNILAFRMTKGSYDQVCVLTLNPGLIVNTTDDLDDGICDEKHCSLREAINEINKKPEYKTIEFNIPATGTPKILIEKELPALKVNAFIDGSSQPGASEVEIDGKGAGSSSNGISISAGEIKLKNLIISNFGTNGILSSSPGELSLIGGNILNCGKFGIKADKTVNIDNSINDSTIVAGNGKGGIFSAKGELNAKKLYVTNNNGPGIVVNLGVYINYCNVSGNRGCGIYSNNEAINLNKFDEKHILSVVSSNQGIGIQSKRKGIYTLCPVEINSNSSWGMVANSGIMINNDAGFVYSSKKSSVNLNGMGDNYYEIESFGDFNSEFNNIQINKTPNIAFGGGIFSKNLYVYIANTDLIENKGPGIVAWQGVGLWGVKIINSEGPGSACIFGKTQLYKWSDGSVCEISNNKGHGIYSRKSIESQCALVIENNYAWGLISKGSINVNDDNGGVVWQNGVTSRISGNGKEDFYFEIPDYDPHEEFFPPIAKVNKKGEFAFGGGILSSERDITGSYIEVNNNNGPGIASQNGIRIKQGQINYNAGPGIHSDREYLEFFATDSKFKSEVVGNMGYGLFCGDGKGISILGTMRIADNNSWGIASKSNVYININDKLKKNYGTSPLFIEGNGIGLEHYVISWDESLMDYSLVTTKPQDKGGILSNGGEVFAYKCEVKNNKGIGIISSSGITISNSKVSNNTTGIFSSDIFESSKCDISFNSEWGVKAKTAVSSRTNILGNQFGGIFVSDTLSFPDSYDYLLSENENISAIFNSSIKQNKGNGVEYFGSKGLNIANTNISGNEGIGVENNGTIDIDAKNNWWGNANGPGEIASGNGDRVSPRVIYSDFSKEPFNLQLDFDTDTVFVQTGFTDSVNLNFRAYLQQTDFSLSLDDSGHLLTGGNKFELTANDSNWGEIPLIFKIPDNSLPGDFFEIEANAISISTNPEQISSKLVIIVYSPSAKALILNKNSIKLKNGMKFNFTANLLDQRGNNINARFNWTAQGGTIDTNGLYFAGDISGLYEVQCSSGNLTSTAKVEILADTLNSIVDANSIFKQKEKAFLIYPNPVQGLLLIHFLTYCQVQSIEVLDIYGRVLLRKEIVLTDNDPIKIDLSKFIDGIYLLKINSLNSVYIDKFIISN